MIDPEIVAASRDYPDHSIFRFTWHFLSPPITFLMAVPRTAKALAQCLFEHGQNYNVWPKGEMEDRLKHGQKVLSSSHSRPARSGSRSPGR